MATAVDQVKRRKVYASQQTPQDVIRDVTSLRELDKEAESKQSRGVNIILAGLALAGLSAVFAFTMAGSNAAIGPIGGIVVGAGMVIGGAIYRSIAGEFNLKDCRYELLVAVLDMLRRDMAIDSVVAARVDFNSPTAKSKFTHKGKLGLWDVSFYRDPWFELQGRLMDGTSFRLYLEELTQQRSRWKRSASGKQKHKQKTKIATTASLHLKPKPQKYPQLDQLSQAAVERLQIPSWCELKKCSISADGIMMKVGAKVDWSLPMQNDAATKNNGAQLIAMMFLSLYRTLNESRQLRKREEGQA